VGEVPATPIQEGLLESLKESGGTEKRPIAYRVVTLKESHCRRKQWLRRRFISFHPVLPADAGSVPCRRRISASSWRAIHGRFDSVRSLVGAAPDLRNDRVPSTHPQETLLCGTVLRGGEEPGALGAGIPSTEVAFESKGEMQREYRKDSPKTQVKPL